MNRLIHTELLKQRTTPVVQIAVLAAPMLAGLITFAVLSTAGRNGNDPLGPDSLTALLAAPASVITTVALLLGILAMAGETRHQTITTTLLATPARPRVLAAKLLSQALVGLALAAATLAVTLVIALPWLRNGGVPIDLGTDHVRVSAGLLAATALWGTLGVAIGALVRNQTAAALGILIWILGIEGLLATVIGWGWLGDWLPVSAAAAMVQLDGPGLSMGAGAAVFTSYVAGLALAAVRITLPRDIT